MIIGWIVALIGVGMIAGSVGSDFSEEFKLPASDSQEAFDLLEDKFPAQSGDTATIVFKADGRGRVAGGEARRWRASSPRSEGCRTSAKSPAPTRAAAPAAISDDGKIAYATVQFDVTTDKLEKDEIKKLIDDRPRRRAATASRSSSAASRSRKSAPKKKATPRS